MHMVAFSRCKTSDAFCSAAIVKCVCWYDASIEHYKMLHYNYASICEYSCLDFIERATSVSVLQQTSTEPLGCGY